MSARSICIALQYTSNKQRLKQEGRAGLRWSEHCHYITQIIRFHYSVIIRSLLFPPMTRQVLYPFCLTPIGWILHSVYITGGY